MWNWNTRTRGTVFWVLVALAVLLLWTVRSVLAPFVIGAILSYLIHPLIQLTSRYTRLPRVGSVAVVYLAVAGLITWGVIVLVPVVSKEARELSITLPRIVARARDIIDQDPHLSFVGYDVSIAPLVDEVTRSVGTVVSAVSRSLLDTAVATVETFFKGMLTLVITFYLLMGAER
ncbi:MAG: AI-2E family transporter, partial [Chloroflexi bacterium]|nr:AI-2E family transporter [Chloroflexota bacterium]